MKNVIYHIGMCLIHILYAIVSIYQATIILLSLGFIFPDMTSKVLELKIKFMFSSYFREMWLE